MPRLPARISTKPQYVLHPGRALRRLIHRPDTAADGGRTVAELTWGLPLEVSTSDAIGYSIVTGGIFDPCVTETLHRLIDPGDRVVDAGANVGYLTSLAAVRTGPQGKVTAFEPHPRVFEILERNAARWPDRAAVGEVELKRLALSDHSGEGTLVSPSFNENMGLGTLATDGNPGQGSDDGDRYSISLARLDEVVQAEPPALLKIDVEGHEAQLLRGAGGLLAGGEIRDIVFEDHDPYPSEATEVVESAGYELISLDNDLFGLRLTAPESRGEVSAWPGPSYLATRDAERARQRLSVRGWQVPGIGPALPRRLRGRAR